MLGITNTTTICRRKISLRGAPTSRMGMTTVWRPRVRIAVPNVGDAEDTDTSRDESTKKGTKRKRAPRHRGPCEHGVKYRSKCKVCGACPHGRRRTQCKECGGASICEHGRLRFQCKECGGASICEHGRNALDARSAVGLQSVSTVVSAISARSAVGRESASTVVSALTARSAVGHRYASTVVSAILARSVRAQHACNTILRFSRVISEYVSILSDAIVISRLITRTSERRSPWRAA